jgi:hypothetical protein
MSTMSIEDRIYFNKFESHELCRSYLEYAFVALLHGYISISELIQLFKQVKNYSKEVELETEYLKLLEQYRFRIKDEEMAKTLRDIDLSNEYTYDYYELLGEYYSDKAFSNFHTFPPRRIVPSLKENTRLTDEIKGYTICDYDLLLYFKGCEGYHYAKEHEKIFDAGYNIWMYGINTLDEHGILGRFEMIVPPITNLQTALINVHEIRNAIDLYEYIGKEYPEENNFEERAKAEEEKFIKEYVRNK